MGRKKILISAYALSPFKGSEFGAAWNTITQLAKYHDLWVLYGVSDVHMGDTSSLKNYLEAKKISGVTFIEVMPGRLAKVINLLNKAGLIWFFYLAFYLWQKQALKVALNILKTTNIDVIHQLGPIGFREPGFLWKINKPFVWGPIGGMHTVHLRLLNNNVAVKTKVKFFVKNIINYLQLNYSRRVRKAMLRANCIIAARGIDKFQIEKYFNRKSVHLPEQGLVNEQLDNRRHLAVKDNVVKIIWSGRHDDGKNLSLCIEALAKVNNPNWRLYILGSGYQTNMLKEACGRLGISSKIVWYGQLQRDRAIEIMSSANLHIITSLSEGNPAVLFEAMSYGIPTISLDHCGMADVICQNCGIKVPIGSYKEVLQAFVVEIERVLSNPNLLVSMSKGAIDCGRRFGVDKRIEILNGAYEQAIDNWNNVNTNGFVTNNI